MSKKIDAKLTRIIPEALFVALGQGWLALKFSPTGEEVPILPRLVLMAHWAIETGHGKYCYNYNLGNAKARPNGSRDFCFRACDEYLPDAVAAAAIKAAQPRADGGRGLNALSGKRTAKRTQVIFMPDNPAACFRAFSSLTLGTLDYLELIHGRYSRAWPALMLGDPGEYIDTIHSLGYFTAAAAPYRATVVSIFEKYKRLGIGAAK